MAATRRTRKPITRGGRTRVERDTLGEMTVPASALWGAQTARAVVNFPISGLREPRALVDAVVYDDVFIGSRAVWDMSKVHTVFLNRAEPGSIGLSSVGSCLQALGARDGQGMYLAIGPGGTQVLAPMGPGLVTRIPIREYHLIPVGSEVTLSSDPCTIALDGERTIEVYGTRTITVRLTNGGPRVVDIAGCMEEATRRKVFERLGTATGRN